MMDNGSIDSSMLWVFGLLAMTALLIVVVARPIARITTAKIAISREDQYRAVAEAAVAAQESSVAAQATTQRRLDEMSTEMAAMRVHLAALEKVLTEVD